MHKLTLLLPLLVSSGAGAQKVDAATQKAIDAHASQFSGQRCAGKFKAKPEGQGSVASFKTAVLALDAGAKAMIEQISKTQPTAHYRSSFNDKDLFRAVISGPKSSSFMMMFWKDGRGYYYSCDLK